MVKKLIKQKVEQHGLRKWLPLIVLSSALMIIIIDTTVLNVSIRTMVADLKTTVQGIQWVISAYALTLAALTVTGGRLGDLFGRKKMFMWGAVLFAIGSFVTSVSPTVTWVIIGNAIIEGIGAALMMPATASLLVNEYHGKDRALAFAIWGATAASASAIGPILGGWLTTNYSWRWAFRINLVVVALLLLGARYIHEARDKSLKFELDFLGVLLTAVGLTSVVYGLIESSTYGWWMATTVFKIFGHSFSPFGLSISPLSIAFGAALLAYFAYYEYRRERAGHTVLVSPELFKNKQFTAGALTTAMLAMGQTGLIFSVPIFYQSVRNLDAFHTGFALIPMSLAVMIAAPMALKLSKKLRPKTIIQIGFGFTVIGTLYLYKVINIDATVWALAPGLFIYGCGMGFAFSQLGNLTLSAVPGEQAGEASGVNNTLRQVGASFGSAIIGAALIATLGSQVVKNINASSAIPDSMKPTITQKLAEAGSNVEFIDHSQTDTLPKTVANAVQHAVHSATVDANKRALQLTVLFAILSLFVSTILPNIREITSKPTAKATH